MLDISLNDKIFIDNELDAAIQELDLILNTENTELIGDTQFGTTLEHFLWTLTPTTEEFNNYIKEKLSTLYYFNQFKHNIHTEYHEGEFRSIYHLIIEIYTDEETYVQKEYTFK